MIRSTPLLAVALFLGMWAPLAAETNAQVPDAALLSMVQGIEADSMRATLEVLTGQRTVYIGDSLNTEEGGWLYNRTVKVYKRHWQANDVAAFVLRSRLESFGLETWIHHPADSVKNVLARIEGVTEPDRQVLIGAHYDAVNDWPGADDNGSGTAAVIEIARLLSKTEPDRTIVFAFWDAEEIGLVGSSLYAQEARARGDDIVGVINLDMIGWSTDEPDMLVASSTSGSSSGLKARILDLASSLDLPINAQGYSMGRSDHVSFASVGYESVMLIENYLGDFNPYYHSPDDTIDRLDFDFLTANTRLAAATLIDAAFDGSAGVGTEDLPTSATLDVVPYPNPAVDVLRFEMLGPVRVDLFDILGRRVAGADGPALDVSGLPMGLYAYRVYRDGETTTGVVAVAR